MAVILDEFPHMAGTASSLAGTFRFGIGALVGALLSLATFNSARPMIWSIAFCASCSILFYLYASRPKNGDQIHNMEAIRLPLLMYVNDNSIISPIYVYFM